MDHRTAALTPRRLPRLVAALAAALALAPLVAEAGSVELRATAGSVVLPAGRTTTAVLKVGLRGLEFLDAERRAPVNLALVLDKSGSMSGEKLEKAKSAALHVLDRLKPDDLLSVVAYDGTVRILVPTTRVADRRAIADAILGLRAGGSTALFAGVSKGVGEVRRLLRRDQVNRVILLSDGQANVGPSSPNALGHLGAACAKEGIAITTVGLGLGYNEDLMVQLAMRSDGNHAFAATADDLPRIFAAELGDVTSVVAQGAQVRIDFAPGVRPRRVLNREATISGQSVFYTVGQIYGAQEKHVVVEVDVDPGVAGTERPFATVTATYLDMPSGKSEHERRALAVRFTDHLAEVEAATNADVMIAHAEALANEQSRLAVDLRDRGAYGEAQRVLELNSAYLDEAASRYNSTRLRNQASENRGDAKNLDEGAWNERRKAIRKRQYELDVQQSF